MTPKSPIALPKISTTKTYSLEKRGRIVRESRQILTVFENFTKQQNKKRTEFHSLITRRTIINNDLNTQVSQNQKLTFDVFYKHHLVFFMITQRSK